MKKNIYLLIVLCSLQGMGQTKIKDLKKDDFLSDFDLMVNIIKKQHPNPFKFISEESFDQKVDSLRKHLVENPDINHFAKSLPIALIKDVHTSGGLSSDINLEFIKKLLCFPYPVYIERGRVFVNIRHGEIPFGSEIIDINGVPVKTVLSGMSGPVDGNIQNGTDLQSESFSFLYGVHYQNQKTCSISFIKPNEKKINRITKSTLLSEESYYRSKKCVLPFNLMQQQYNIYSEFRDDNKTGILTVNSFKLDESFAYKEFNDFFKKIATEGYKEVIIDIRNNPGGSPAIAALLFSFVAKASFSNVYSYKTKNIKLMYPEYAVDNQNRKFSENDIRAQDDFMYQRFDKIDSLGGYKGNSRLTEGLISDYPKDKDAFSGNLKVLIGPGTISAATYFASLVRNNKRGIIIGKETGSGFDATTAAWFMDYELPGTKSTLRIPVSEIYFFNSEHDRGRGLLPDKEVPINIFLDYMLKMKDPEMSFAIDNL